jgi:hypothetical protein
MVRPLPGSRSARCPTCCDLHAGRQARAGRQRGRAERRLHHRSRGVGQHHRPAERHHAADAGPRTHRDVHEVQRRGAGPVDPDLRPRRHGRAGPRARVHHGVEGRGPPGSRCRKTMPSRYWTSRRASSPRCARSGFKDHLLPGNELDVSDRDDGGSTSPTGRSMACTSPTRSPATSTAGRTYIVTANEGDARDYDGLQRGVALPCPVGRHPGLRRFDRASTPFYASNEMGITDLSQLRDNANMGRLTVTTATGLRADGSCYEAIYAFGARSFSIWNARPSRSGTAARSSSASPPRRYPEFFNSNTSENELRHPQRQQGSGAGRCDIAKLWGRDLRLHRAGADRRRDDLRHQQPLRPQFVQYFNNRDFNFAPGTPEAGDLGAEGLIVIEASKSPIPGCSAAGRRQRGQRYDDDLPHQP